MSDQEQAQSAPPSPTQSTTQEETYKQRIDELEKLHYIEYKARKRKQQRLMNLKLYQKKQELQELINHKRDIDDRLRYVIDEETDEEASDDSEPDFDPDYDPDFDVDFDPNVDKKDKFNFQSIPQKVGVYDGMLEIINEELMAIKNGLDSYESYLHKINSFVQLSVIVLSVASSFVQALNSKSYEIIFSDPVSDLSTNITQIIDDTDTGGGGGGAMDQDTYSKMVPIITLSISTYSALVISTERHFSFESREGNVNNLKGLYSELISRIKYQRELLKPWKNPNYYKDQSEDKKQSWKSILKNIDQEYCHIIDIKRELYTAYEKIVNTGVYDKYRDLFKYDKKTTETTETTETTTEGQP